MKSTWITALGAGLMLAAMSATGASAQDAATQTRSYLEHGLAAHAEHGYARDRSIPDLTQGLRLGSAYLWPIYLRADTNYRVYAACDNDCTDVDMEIYGADGLLVDRDIETNDIPYVQITPNATGRHYVRLWVYQCSAEPCFVAARVVSGGTPVDRETSDGEQLEPNEYEDVVRSELDAAGERHLQAGYQRFGDDVILPVTVESGGHSEVVRLQAGRSYIFQGACDQDCSDVDMEILDPAGAQIVQDVALDDRPVVTLRPTRAGDYTVRTWLATCGVEPCFVGMRGYSR